MSADRHIVHLIDHLGAGGAQRLLADIVPVQVRRGARVTVVCLRRPTPLSEALAHAGGTVRCLDAHKADPRQPAALLSLLRNLQPDLLHAHLTISCMLGRAVATLLGIPTVVHDHEASAEVFITPGPLLALKRLAEPRMPAQRVRYIVISRSAERYAVAVRHLPPNLLTLVPNGVDAIHLETDRLTPDAARSRLNLPTDVPLIGFLGRLAPEKGIDTLLAALQLLPEAHLALAGRGPLAEQVHANIGAAGLAERVHLLGHLEDARPLLWASDVYTQPSYREAFGLAAAEAAAVGLPVVASRVGGLPDVVLDGLTGSLVTPGDPTALADALGALLADQQHARRMGEAGRRHARASFDIQGVVDRIGQVYDELQPALSRA